MPWFYCDDCGESIKKPKLAAHASRCSASSFTCIDCSLTFDPVTVQRHTSCVTEKEKYVDGATKPGGYAANGFVSKTVGGAPAEGRILGEEFLSTRPPWRCELCDTRCTSQETLLAHAKGMKHKRKVRRAMEESTVTQQQPVVQAQMPVAPVHTHSCKAAFLSVPFKAPAVITEVDERKKPCLKKKGLKRQVRLGVEILSTGQKGARGMSIARFLARFQKKCKRAGIDGNVDRILQKVPQCNGFSDRCDLDCAQMAKTASVEMTEKRIYLKLKSESEVPN